MKKILINFGDYNYNVQRRMENTYGGVGYYRLIKPAEQVKKLDDVEVTVWGTEIKKAGHTLEEQWNNVFTNFDVYWTSYFASAEAAAAIFYHRDKHKKMVILDIDDNYLDILPTNPLFAEFGPGKHKRAYMSAALSFADVITTSTEPLKKKIEDHMLKVHGLHKNVVVIPNFNDVKDWEFEKKENTGNKITIGYSGSNSHQDDLLMVMPAVRKVMEKHDNVYFQCLGAMDSKYIPLYFKGFGDKLLKRCDIVASTQTFKEYPKWLAKQSWDIGIAPLVDSPFTICKSHIKFMEYAMYKIPTIASRVYPYFMPLMGRDVIEDGVNGLLVKPTEWEAALNRLVEDKELRDTLGRAAYESVSRDWQYENSGIDKIVKEFLG